MLSIVGVVAMTPPRVRYSIRTLGRLGLWFGIWSETPAGSYARRTMTRVGHPKADSVAPPRSTPAAHPIDMHRHFCQIGTWPVADVILGACSADSRAATLASHLQSRSSTARYRPGKRPSSLPLLHRSTLSPVSAATRMQLGRRRRTKFHEVLSSHVIIVRSLVNRRSIIACSLTSHTSASKAKPCT